MCTAKTITLSRAGKVRAQTPKVCKIDKRKSPTGRAKKRLNCMWQPNVL